MGYGWRRVDGNALVWWRLSWSPACPRGFVGLQSRQNASPEVNATSFQSVVALMVAIHLEPSDSMHSIGDA